MIKWSLIKINSVSRRDRCPGGCYDNLALCVAAHYNVSTLLTTSTSYVPFATWPDARTQHTGAHTHRCTHMDRQTQAHTHRCTHTGAHIHGQAHTDRHVDRRTHPCAHTHTHRGTHKQTGTHRCTYTRLSAELDQLPSCCLQEGGCESSGPQ